MIWSSSVAVHHIPIILAFFFETQTKKLFFSAIFCTYEKVVDAICMKIVQEITRLKPIKTKYLSYDLLFYEKSMAISVRQLRLEKLLDQFVAFAASW
jgi:hypothetical protein